MENTSDSFMPRPLLFCLKSGRSVCYSVPDNTYIQLCLAMSQLAKMVRTASSKPQQTDNEKYAMRCWMLRLGFIGDEFATAREILLRNMEGNASWRNK